MYIVATIVIIVGVFLFWDWHARMVFIARGYVRRYGHGKSWNRAHKHYKREWSLTQRLLWIPVFRERYEFEYHFMVWLSYIHLAFAAITSIVFVVDELLLTNLHFWHYVFVGYAIFIILRFIYTNAMARGYLL